MKYLIIAYAKLRFYFAKDKGTNYAVIFCDMGIGNFIMMVPFIRRLTPLFNLTFVTSSNEIRYLINELFKKDTVRLSDLKGHYDYCFCSALCQNKATIKKIIQLNIKHRYGQNYKGLNKWKAIFSKTNYCSINTPELQNNMLMFRRTSVKYDLFHSFNGRKENYVVIQAHSSYEPSRNYEHYKEIINEISKTHLIYLVGNVNEYEYCDSYHITNKVINTCGIISFKAVCHLIQAAKLYIGNDSGLAHVSVMCQTTTFILWTNHNVLGKVSHPFNHVYNFYNPRPHQIIKIAINELNN